MEQAITLDELKAASDSFYAALGDVLAGDAQSMRDLWSRADDACYMGPMGEIVVGGEAIQDAWQQQAVALLGGAVTPSDLHLVTGGKLGIVTNWEHGVGHTGISNEIHIRVTSTYRREEGQIRMIGHHTDLITP